MHRIYNIILSFYNGYIENGYIEMWDPPEMFTFVTYLYFMSECLRYYFVFCSVMSPDVVLFVVTFIFFHFWYAMSPINLLKYHYSLISREYSSIIYILYLFVLSTIFTFYALKFYTIVCFMYVIFSSVWLNTVVIFLVCFPNYWLFFGHWRFSSTWPPTVFTWNNKWDYFH